MDPFTTACWRVYVERVREVVEYDKLLVLRLRALNEGAFRCRENSLAITHLEEALHWLEARTKARVAQGVEGTNQPHQEAP